MLVARLSQIFFFFRNRSSFHCDIPVSSVDLATVAWCLFPYQVSSQGVLQRSSLPPDFPLKMKEKFQFVFEFKDKAIDTHYMHKNFHEHVDLITGFYEDYCGEVSFSKKGVIKLFAVLSL